MSAAEAMPSQSDECSALSAQQTPLKQSKSVRQGVPASCGGTLCLQEEPKRLLPLCCVTDKKIRPHAPHRTTAAKTQTPDWCAPKMHSSTLFKLRVQPWAQLPSHFFTLDCCSSDSHQNHSQQSAPKSTLRDNSFLQRYHIYPQREPTRNAVTIQAKACRYAHRKHSKRLFLLLHTVCPLFLTAFSVLSAYLLLFREWGSLRSFSPWKADF